MVNAEQYTYSRFLKCTYINNHYIHWYEYLVPYTRGMQETCLFWSFSTLFFIICSLSSYGFHISIVQYMGMY